MSSSFHDHHGAHHTISSESDDPFISPEFHLRNRSSSSTPCPLSIPSTTVSVPEATSARHGWSSFGLGTHISRIGATPLRWFCILLCLTLTFLVWHWPPPTASDVSFQVEEQFPTSPLQILQPHDPAVARKANPEEWLRENTEDALARKKRWWKRAPPKPRAAIISLVRNEELDGILQSMRQLEYHWNRKYQYPWIFFNEKPFSDEFKVKRDVPHSLTFDVH